MAPPDILIPSQRLTPREREVLQHVADGCILKEIAERLALSMSTVETHMEHIRKKKGVQTASAAVAAAFRAGEVR